MANLMLKLLAILAVSDYFLIASVSSIAVSIFLCNFSVILSFFSLKSCQFPKSQQSENFFCNGTNRNIFGLVDPMICHNYSTLPL